MPKKGIPFEELLIEELSDPEVAAYYLNDAYADSKEALLKAMAIVAKASNVSRVAKEAGVQRETLYRSLSQQGNPTLETFTSILSVLGVGIKFVAKGRSEQAIRPLKGGVKGGESIFRKFTKDARPSSSRFAVTEPWGEGATTVRFEFLPRPRIENPEDSEVAEAPGAQLPKPWQTELTAQYAGV